jgi:lipid-A-disaccharide synthase-like uncharacterized protein
MLSILVYIFGKKKDKTALWISLWPLITISSLILIILALALNIDTNIDYFLLLGNMTSLSLFIFIGTISFALSSLWSIYYIYKNRNKKKPKLFYYHSVLAAVFNLIFTIYFFSNGIIGLMTWI